MSGDHLDHNNDHPSSSGDWQFGNQTMNLGHTGSFQANPFYPNPWNNVSNPQNSGGFSESQAATTLPPSLDTGMFMPVSSGCQVFDSSFIERAAKFSSFGAMVNHFGSSESLSPSPYPNASKNVSGAQTPAGVKDCSMSINRSKDESPVSKQRGNGSGREETPDMANVSGDSSSKGANAKKRKKNSQDMELDQVQEGQQFPAEIQQENVETKPNVECSSSTAATGKSSGKNAKGSTEEGKQDYIHVRARRGQATNSHSLAERVRRERISERMKYLQELVPGCSKVTGKAVMLDEIINYVQSLQRQVEFLSMKLATVNPSIDLNIEQLLSKDILQPKIGLSPMGFSTDHMHSQLLQSHQGLAQAGISSMANHVDALRRAVNAQFAALNGFKEPMPQISNPWDTELQSMFPVNFSTDSVPNAQEFNGKPHDGFSL